MAEKIESLTDLIAEEMEILATQPSMSADDVEMIGKETELIVTTVLSKGKAGGKEGAETGVSDVGNQRVGFGLSAPRSCLRIEHTKRVCVQL